MSVFLRDKCFDTMKFISEKPYPIAAESASVMIPFPQETFPSSYPSSPRRIIAFNFCINSSY